ncbi:MAG TPA: hypothetical protein VFE77_14625 [Rhodanobacter sp.]|nr:hypothetical protein [Rhodanobacter sp.]
MGSGTVYGRHTHTPDIRPAGGAGLYGILIRLNANPHRFLMVSALGESSIVNPPEGPVMLDLLMLALAAGLFVLTIGYAYACDRL